jgi:hypothetical protein
VKGFQGKNCFILELNDYNSSVFGGKLIATSLIIPQNRGMAHISHFKYTTRVFLMNKVDYSLYYY